jgi:RHS repeat-associated protein
MQLYFIHTDHLNTPRVITNQAAQVVWRWDQTDPFGGNPPDENPSGLGIFTCNLRLPGQYFDKETNLHYNYFRDYDPRIGRYIQSDPIGLRGGINTFTYVANDPIGLYDPKGLLVQIGYFRGRPTDPQGNFKRGFDAQDQICTLGRLRATVERNSCVLECCEVHDSCYEVFGCNETSWLGNYWGYNYACQRCNSATVACIRKAWSDCPDLRCNR